MRTMLISASRLLTVTLSNYDKEARLNLHQQPPGSMYVDKGDRVGDVDASHYTTESSLVFNTPTSPAGFSQSFTFSTDSSWGSEDLKVISLDPTFLAATNIEANGNLVNTVYLYTNLIVPGKPILISGWDVNVSPGVIISTRTISGSDYENAKSTGDSADITFEPVNLDLESDASHDGVKIYAQAKGTFYSGKVTIDAQNDSGWGIGWLDWIRQHLFPLIGTDQGVYVNFSDVTMTDARIMGDSVDITSTGGYVDTTPSPRNWTASWIILPSVNFSPA